MNPENIYTLKKDSEHGFLSVDPLPTDAEIRDFYAREFYSGEYKNFNNSSLDVQERDSDYHELQRQMLLDSLEALLERPIAGQDIFDFGCGWGLTLKFFEKRGAKCFGLDPSNEAVAYCQREGLSVSLGNIDDLDSVSERNFDVILMQNVLEHLKYPVHSLKMLSNRLKPGGVLVVAVPNDFNDFQLCATEVLGLPQWWVAPPAHLCYFDQDSLSSILNSVGLKVARTECSFPIEMFLLFGENYISNPELGRDAHVKRMKFEMALVKTGRTNVLRNFYAHLAQAGLGRILTAYAVKSGI